MAKLNPLEIEALQELQEAGLELKETKKMLDNVQARYKAARAKALKTCPLLVKALIVDRDEDEDE
jgi:DNA-binding transcriptional MerR regulator